MQAGADQRRLLVGLVERAKRQHLLRADADPEALTRVYLAWSKGSSSNRPGSRRSMRRDTCTSST